MQVTETNKTGLKREFSVVIGARELEEKLDSRLSEVGKSVRIPGFRPGKVPTKVLKQRFGQQVMGEVLENAVNDSSSQALQERGLQPAVQPKIEITNFEEGGDLEYKMEVELMPEFEPMDFSELELERLQVEIPDSEVDEALQHLAAKRKETKPLEKDRPSQKGDVLVLDFAGTVDGEALPGMSGEDHHLELGSNRFVEGFEDQLIGISKGEETEVKVTFPDEYVNDKLAGKEAVFQVKVKDILAAEPRPIDDELAKSLGEEDLNSLKQRVREQIEQDYAQYTRSRMKRELLDKLAEKHDFQVPEGMIEAEFGAIWPQVEEDMKKGRLDPEDADKDEETLKQEYRDIAERRVRLGLLLSEVGRRNNIDVTQEELNRQLMQEVQRYPGQEREVLEYYQKNPQAQANLRAPIYEEKVVDFISELAQVKEKTVSADELRAEISGEDSADSASKDKKQSKGSAKKSGGKSAGGSKATAKKSGGKATGTLETDTPLAERRNTVFMNTNAIRGRGRAVVVATGM
ncbi:MAG: trigger factor, partial [Rhodovibrionaceae bacterium]|nr:trigger factor [Rhodovibrionaceae bacterium]